jgi:hypothetical protein
MEQPLDTTQAPLKNHILRTLSYFDIFNYPLTASELETFLGCKIEHDQLNLELAKLVNEGVIFETQNFFSVQNNELIVIRRLKGNAEAKRLLPLAIEKAKFIFSFPFIRAIMVSGSLSKNYMDERSDLDFFIITEPKRLWIARTIFDFYRKLFIRKKNWKHYCLNYFISFDQLAIDEQNIFTATELATLKPLIGIEYHKNLLENNRWIHQYFPNNKMGPILDQVEVSNLSQKIKLEKTINFMLADYVEPIVRWIRYSWFRIKFEKKFSKSDFKVAFKSRPHVSKVHSTNGQSRILRAYNSNLKRLHLTADLYEE